MIRVSILYPNREGGRFDLQYYVDVHMPMSIARLRPAMRGVSVEAGLSGVPAGAAPAFVAMTHFLFDSIDAFVAAFTPHQQELQGDMPNYTDIEPVIQFNEVRLAQ